MTIVAACPSDVVQPSVDRLCMSQSWFGCATVEVACYPERDKCTDEASCEEMLAKLKRLKTLATLEAAKNGTVASISRDGRSKTYRGVNAIKAHLSWLDGEISIYEARCGDSAGDCIRNNPASLSFTGGRW